MIKSAGAGVGVIALMLMLGLTACDDTAPAKDDPGPPQTLLTYQRSGGFAGLTQRVQVLTDGTATLEGTGGKLNRFEISDERVGQLTDTLEGIDWARRRPTSEHNVCRLLRPRHRVRGSPHVDDGDRQLRARVEGSADSHQHHRLGGLAVGGEALSQP